MCAGRLAVLFALACIIAVSHAGAVWDRPGNEATELLQLPGNIKATTFGWMTNLWDTLLDFLMLGPSMQTQEQDLEFSSSKLAHTRIGRSSEFYEEDDDDFEDGDLEGSGNEYFAEESPVYPEDITWPVNCTEDECFDIDSEGVIVNMTQDGMQIEFADLVQNCSGSTCEDLVEANETMVEVLNNQIGNRENFARQLEFNITPNATRFFLNFTGFTYESLVYVKKDGTLGFSGRWDIGRSLDQNDTLNFNETDILTESNFTSDPWALDLEHTSFSNESDIFFYDSEIQKLNSSHGSIVYIEASNSSSSFSPALHSQSKDLNNGTDVESFHAWIDSSNVTTKTLAVVLGINNNSVHFITVNRNNHVSSNGGDFSRSVNIQANDTSLLYHGSETRNVNTSGLNSHFLSINSNVSTLLVSSRDRLDYARALDLSLVPNEQLLSLVDLNNILSQTSLPPELLSMPQKEALLQKVPLLTDLTESQKAAFLSRDVMNFTNTINVLSENEKNKLIQLSPIFEQLTNLPGNDKLLIFPNKFVSSDSNSGADNVELKNSSNTSDVLSFNNISNFTSFNATDDLPFSLFFFNQTEEPNKTLSSNLTTERPTTTSLISDSDAEQLFTTSSPMFNTTEEHFPSTSVSNVSSEFSNATSEQSTTTEEPLNANDSISGATTISTLNSTETLSTENATSSEPTVFTPSKEPSLTNLTITFPRVNTTESLVSMNQTITPTVESLSTGNATGTTSESSVSTSSEEPSNETITFSTVDITGSSVFNQSNTTTTVASTTFPSDTPVNITNEPQTISTVTRLPPSNQTLPEVSSSSSFTSTSTTTEGHVSEVSNNSSSSTTEKFVSEVPVTFPSNTELLSTTAHEENDTVATNTSTTEITSTPSVLFTSQTPGTSTKGTSTNTAENTTGSELQTASTTLLLPSPNQTQPDVSSSSPLPFTTETVSNTTSNESENVSTTTLPVETSSSTVPFTTELSGLPTAANTTSNETENISTTPLIPILNQTLPDTTSSSPLPISTELPSLPTAPNTDSNGTENGTTTTLLPTLNQTLPDVTSSSQFPTTTEFSTLSTVSNTTSNEAQNVSTTPLLPTLNQTLPDVTYPLPTLNQTHPDVTYPLPTLNQTLPDVTSPLATLNQTLPDVTSPLPTLNQTLPDVTSPLPTLSQTLPDVTSPMTTLNQTLPDVTSPLPTLNQTQPDVTYPMPSTTEFSNLTTTSQAENATVSTIETTSSPNVTTIVPSTTTPFSTSPSTITTTTVLQQVTYKSPNAYDHFEFGSLDSQLEEHSGAVYVLEESPGNQHVQGQDHYVPPYDVDHYANAPQHHGPSYEDGHHVGPNLDRPPYVEDPYVAGPQHPEPPYWEEQYIHIYQPGSPPYLEDPNQYGHQHASLPYGEGQHGHGPDMIPHYEPPQDRRPMFEFQSPEERRRYRKLTHGENRGPVVFPQDEFPVEESTYGGFALPDNKYQSVPQLSPPRGLGDLHYIVARRLPFDPASEKPASFPYQLPTTQPMAAYYE